MGVKISDKNNIPDLIKNLSGMKNRKIEAGILEEGEQAMIAHVHEYGVDIAVTPRMRAYLHYMDIHLRKDTTHIQIPERSFIRSGWDNNESDIKSQIELFLGDAIDNGNDLETLLGAIGEVIEGRLKDQLREVSSPPNSDATIAQKGSSNPLIDTGSLLSSISHRAE